MAVTIVFLLTATVALWQIGWGREEALGQFWRAAVLWTCVANLAFGTLLALVQMFWPVSRWCRCSPADAAWPAATFAAVAVMIVLVLMPPRWPAPKVSLATAAGAILALAIYFIALEAGTRAFDRELIAQITSPADHSGGGLAICDAPVTTACARRAAARLAMPVAWIALPPAWHAQLSLFTRGKGTVTEFGDLNQGSRVILVWSRIRADPSPDQIVHRDGVAIRVSSTVHGLNAEWKRDGVRYGLRLVWERPQLKSKAELMRVWRAIRYAAPPRDS